VNGRPPKLRVTALSGGVGGARLVAGLAGLDDVELTVVVNTGDDFEHWGLRICPDLDTVMYTLAGLSDRTRGWGLAGETFRARDMMRRYGAPTWFNLGDADLATHLVRTEALRGGESLSAVTARMSAALGIAARILAATDEPRPTMVALAAGGELPFQRWFVEQRCPPCRGVRYVGTDRPADGVIEAIAGADVVVFAPSNPYVSLLPIVSLAGVRDALAARPCVGVSPIVGGRAVKGPLAAMLTEIDGEQPGPAAIVARYGGLLDALVVEHGDAMPIAGVRVVASSTVMRSADARRALGRVVVDVGRDLQRAYS